MMFTDNAIKKEELTFSEKSFIAVLVSAVVLVIAYQFSSGISGNDYWWHIKLGEKIWQQKSIPTTDIFSWYGMEQGIKCTVHEWLADVFLYLVQKAFGAFGMFMMSFLSAVTIVLLSMKTVGKRIFQNTALSILFFCLFAALTTLFFYGRPHIFSIYLLFAAIHCLRRYYLNPESKCIWFLPLIGCLWSNFHGGSSNLSYLLCIGFLVCGLTKIDIGKLYSERMPRRWIITLVIVTGLTMVSVLINPIGLDIFVYPYVNMADTFMLAVVSEWAAPDAKKIADLLLYFLPVFMVIGSLIVTEKKIKFLDLAILMFFVFIFLRSVRFIIFFYIVASFFAFEYFPKWKSKETTGKHGKAVVVTLVALIGIGVVFCATRVIPKVSDGTLISTVLSEEAIETIKAEDPQRLYNDYNFGETLIYNDIPVFFDSRADLYSANNMLKDGISLVQLQSADGEGVFDVNALMDKYQFDGYIIPVKRPLYTYLASHSEKYLLVYSDDLAGYFRVLG